MNKYTIKTPSVVKDVSWEIHIFGCKDINKDDPTQVFDIEAESPDDVIKKDGGEKEKENYRIMPCCNKVPKKISEHFSSLGKKSWEKRKNDLLSN